MRRALATIVLAMCLGAAHADTQRELTLARPGQSSPTILTLSIDATLVECDREAILNFYCLRADASSEAAILSEFSASIERQGWALLGADTENRPITYIFTRPQPGAECPLLIMITSATSTQGSRPPLTAGTIEIQLAQTVDMTCLFD
jgi:hypothetical protein